MGVPTQSSKGLRVTTQCRDIDEFVRAFHRYCEDAGIFISNARRSVGEVVAFSFDLADGSPALAGLGAVVEQFATADNRFGRPGVVVALHRLTRSARRVFDEIVSARVQAIEEHDTTPVPFQFAEARTYTANIQMLDPETLTPVPQPPPRPVPAAPVLPEPSAAEAPIAPKLPRATTVSIAAIPGRLPASRTPPGIKIPSIVPQSIPTIVVQPEVATAAPPSAVAAPSEEVADETARTPVPPTAFIVPRSPVLPEPVVAARAPEPPNVATMPRAESGGFEPPRLAPAPVEFLDSHTDEQTTEGPTRPGAFARSSEAALFAAATAAPEPEPAPLPEAPALPPPPELTPAPTRWTKRRVWAVAVIAGSSLLAIGILIGATFVGGDSRAPAPPSQTMTVSPTPATPAPIAAAPTPPAPVPAPAEPIAATPPPTPPAPAPAEVAPPAPPTPEPTPTPTSEVATASPPPVAAKVSPAPVPAHAIAKSPSRPKPPPPKPAHPKHHKHAASPAACTSLTCL